MSTPAVPTGLTVSNVTATGLTISWADGAGDDPTAQFKIYGSPASSVYITYATVDVTITSLVVTTLSPSTAYSFKISALDADDNESAQSDPVAAMTLGLTPVTSTPSLGLQFQDLILRVAEYLGVADYSGGAAAIPTDAHDLDLCKRLCNDGLARVVIEKEWACLDVSMTITPDGINYIFDLPADFQGEIVETWTYPITGPITQIRETSDLHIRALRAGTNTTGYPTLYALIAKDEVDSTTNTARWQVMFWPTPYDNTLLLTAKYRRFGIQMVNLTDRSVMGPQNDQTVKQAAMAAAEVQRYGTQGPQEQLYQQFLVLSKRKDDAGVTNNLGDYGDRSDEGMLYGRRRPRDQYRVDTYDGMDVLDVAN